MSEDKQLSAYAEALCGVMGWRAVLAGARPTIEQQEAASQWSERGRSALVRMLNGRFRPFRAIVDIERLRTALADESLPEGIGAEDELAGELLMAAQRIRDNIRAKLKRPAPGDLLQDLLDIDEMPTGDRDVLIDAAIAGDADSFLAEIEAGDLDSSLVVDFAACYPLLYRDLSAQAIEAVTEVKAGNKRFSPSQRTSQQFEVLLQARNPAAPETKADDDRTRDGGSGGSARPPDESTRAQRLSK